MTYKNNTKKYVDASQHTTKIRQIIMLYEGMIKFVTNAKTAIENNDAEARFNMIERSIKIITALRAAIDFSIKGDVPHILAEYYDIIDRKLMDVHLTHNVKSCEEVIYALSSMKSTWIEIETSDNLPVVLNTNFENLHISI